MSTDHQDLENKVFVTKTERNEEVKMFFVLDRLTD